MKDNDIFHGDNKKLAASIEALLALDAKGALVPHGIGGHARTLLSTAVQRLAAAEAGIKWEADRNALLLAELESSEALDRAEVVLPRPIRFADLPVTQADFDRVTAERDAALEEVEALKHWRDLALQFDNHRMKALWHLKTLVSDGAHCDAAAAFLAEPPVPASELQQRLTAADERNDNRDSEIFAQVQSALRRSFSLGQIYWQHADSDSTCQQNKSDQTMEVQEQHILNVLKSLGAALKPVEGGGDDTTLEEDREDFKKVFVRTNTKQGQSISLADMIARYEKKP